MLFQILPSGLSEEILSVRMTQERTYVILTKAMPRKNLFFTYPFYIPSKNLSTTSCLNLGERLAKYAVKPVTLTTKSG